MLPLLDLLVHRGCCFDEFFCGLTDVVLARAGDASLGLFVEDLLDECVSLGVLGHLLALLDSRIGHPFLLDVVRLWTWLALRLLVVFVEEAAFLRDVLVVLRCFSCLRLRLVLTIEDLLRVVEVILMNLVSFDAPSSVLTGRYVVHVTHVHEVH